MASSLKFDWPAALTLSGLPGTVRDTGIIMWSYSDRDGCNIRPGREKLAEVRKLSPRVISRHVKELTDGDFLVCTEDGRRGGNRNHVSVYRLALPGADHVTLRPSHDPADHVTPRASHDPADHVTKTGGFEPDHVTPRSVHPTSPKNKTTTTAVAEDQNSIEEIAKKPVDQCTEPECEQMRAAGYEVYLSQGGNNWVDRWRKRRLPPEPEPEPEEYPGWVIDEHHELAERMGVTNIWPSIRLAIREGNNKPAYLKGILNNGGAPDDTKASGRISREWEE